MCVCVCVCVGVNTRTHGGQPDVAIMNILMNPSLCGWEKVRHSWLFKGLNKLILGLCCVSPALWRDKVSNGRGFSHSAHTTHMKHFQPNTLRGVKLLSQ